MRKLMMLVLSLALCLTLVLTGCAQTPAGGDTTAPDTTAPDTTAPDTTEPDATEPDTTAPEASGELSGSAADVLASLVAASGLELGMTFDEAVTAETCQSYLGLTPEQLETYVAEAQISMAAITTNAHQIAVIRANNAEDAATVKGLVAEGFDSGRWICVRPEQSFVVEAGEYVILVASNNDNAEGLKTGAQTLAGDALGEIDVFFTGLE